MSPRNKASEFKTYLRKIRPFPSLSPETMQRLNPVCIGEFLRIEALLRSMVMFNIYRRGRQSGERDLKDFYQVDWGIFRGRHHILLKPRAKWVTIRLVRWPRSLLRPQSGIEDLADLILCTPRSLDLDPVLTGLAKDASSLLLKINAAFPPERIIKALRDLLKERHKEIFAAQNRLDKLKRTLRKNEDDRERKRRKEKEKAKKEGRRPRLRRWMWDSEKDPLVKAIRKLEPLTVHLPTLRAEVFAHPNSLVTWHRNFDCYDLQSQGVSYATIADRQYRTVKQRKAPKSDPECPPGEQPPEWEVKMRLKEKELNWAKFAVSSVRTWIQSAVENSWPPASETKRREILRRR